MRLIVHLGIIALMAAVGASLGQQFHTEQGTRVGAFLGGLLGLLVISTLRAGTRGK